YDGETDGLLYGLEEVQEIISKRFQDAEDLNEPVILAFEIELDLRLVECIFPEFQPNVRDIHLNTRKKIFTGCATAYLGCTQREDRRYHRPKNLPVK
ncbi:15844_t:CDS:2, partial [Rhizophagus irregularis]